MSATERVVQSKITGKIKSGDRPLVFTHGTGPYVWDQDEQRYIDFVCGYGPVIVGHADEEFNRRLAECLSSGLMMPGYTSFHEEYLGRLLVARPQDRGAPFKTASEAVTAAFRLAALRTGKAGMVRSGFVGWHDAQIANTPKWHEPLRSPLRQRLRHTEGMRGVGPSEPAFNWLDLRLESLARLLDEHRDAVGCFIFDAYLASFVEPGLVGRAFDMCRAAGCPTVLDETKTGRRISRLGYGHDHGVDADLTVIGKSLANGAPLSVLIGDAKLMALAQLARLSGTFSKEMFAIYAALATLRHPRAAGRRVSRRLAGAGPNRHPHRVCGDQGGGGRRRRLTRLGAAGPRQGEEDPGETVPTLGDALAAAELSDRVMDDLLRRAEEPSGADDPPGRVPVGAAGG
jgi:glutamate-1-semialdehyde aminotransferase